jgi:hypothetical protein
MTSSLSRFKAETELGPPVVEWLTREGFEVYQEVDVGPIADVVGVRGPLVVVVELKLTLSFDLLAQARGWRWCAHQVWAAVPLAKRTDGRRMAIDCFEQMGVGVLEVDRRHDGEAYVARAIVRPTFIRLAGGRKYIAPALREENRTLAKAGSPAGARDWSEFKQTCRAVRELVRAKPGATIREVVAGLDHHHYATDAGARASLVERIGRGVVEGVQIRRDGAGPWRLYPTDAQEGGAA